MRRQAERGVLVQSTAISPSTTTLLRRDDRVRRGEHQRDSSRLTLTVGTKAAAPDISSMPSFCLCTAPKGEPPAWLSGWLPDPPRCSHAGAIPRPRSHVCFRTKAVTGAPGSSPHPCSSPSPVRPFAVTADADTPLLVNAGPAGPSPANFESTFPVEIDERPELRGSEGTRRHRSLARTDNHRFRVLEPDSDQTKALRALTRGREDLVGMRTALTNQLRAELERFWPGPLGLFTDWVRVPWRDFNRPGGRRRGCSVIHGLGGVLVCGDSASTRRSHRCCEGRVA